MNLMNQNNAKIFKTYTTRDHSTFLNKYSPEDERLYDKL